MSEDGSYPPTGMHIREDGTIGFAPGNELWKKRLSHGVRERKFEKAEDLLAEVVGYFNWAHHNPLQESRLISYEGGGSLHDVPKMRAMTLAGLCLYCGISRETWGGWRRKGDRHRSDLADVIQFAEDHMYSHKFEGAAAGLLNANIIARDLGLSEKTELTGPDGGPLRTISTEMTPQEAAEAWADTIRYSEED